MITKKQQKAIELMFEGNLSQIEISQQLNINSVTLSRWKQKPEFIEAMKDYTDKKISRTVPKALSTMVHLLNARSELVRFNAAKDLLDRAGFIPTQKHDIKGDITVPQILDDIPNKGDADG